MPSIPPSWHPSRWVCLRLGIVLALGGLTACQPAIPQVQETSSPAVARVTPSPTDRPTPTQTRGGSNDPTGMPPSATPLPAGMTDCLADLPAESALLPQPANLLMQIVLPAGMGIWQRSLINERSVTRDGRIRAATWWLLRDAPPTGRTSDGLRSPDLDGRWVPDTCRTWTISATVLQDFQTRLADPALQALQPHDVQPPRTCPDYGGYVLINGLTPNQPGLYVTECPSQTASLQTLLTRLYQLEPLATTP